MQAERAILLVEDNEDDIFLMQRALRDAGVRNRLIIVEDGEQALDYFKGVGKYADRGAYPLPTLVFLDLKLPLRSGHDVLRWIREQESFRSIIVVVLTSSEEPSDISRSYQLGANSFLTKPPPGEELLALTKAFRCYWIDHNRYAEAST